MIAKQQAGANGAEYWNCLVHPGGHCHGDHVKAFARSHLPRHDDTVHASQDTRGCSPWPIGCRFSPSRQTSSRFSVVLMSPVQVVRFHGPDDILVHLPSRHLVPAPHGRGRWCRLRAFRRGEQIQVPFQRRTWLRLGEVREVHYLPIQPRLDSREPGPAGSEIIVSSDSVSSRDFRYRPMGKGLHTLNTFSFLSAQGVEHPRSFGLNTPAKDGYPATIV